MDALPRPTLLALVHCLLHGSSPHIRPLPRVTAPPPPSPCAQPPAPGHPGPCPWPPPPALGRCPESSIAGLRRRLLAPRSRQGPASPCPTQSPHPASLVGRIQFPFTQLRRRRTAFYAHVQWGLNPVRSSSKKAPLAPSKPSSTVWTHVPSSAMSP